MTNKEKFKQIFGIDINNICEINWDSTYGKQKKYHVILRHNKHSWCPYKVICELDLFASNKKDAREKAIKMLGDKYKRWASGVPMDKLEIVENNISDKEGNLHGN